MGREIKFRAFVENADSKYMAIQGTPDLETLGSFMHHYGDQKLLMQFTGLKDKNGIEIYEGDIIKLIFSEYYSNYCVTVDEESIVVGVVVFESGGYFINEKDSTWYWFFDMPEVAEIIIIGNIHENPELLIKKDEE